MRICIVADTLPGIHAHWSGAEVIATKLGTMLHQADQEVVYLTTWGPKQPERKDVVMVRTLLPNFHILKQVVIDPLVFLGALLALRRIKPDVVHFHCKTLFLSVEAAALLLNIPVVLTFLDYFNICPVNTFLKADNQLCKESHGFQCAPCFTGKSLARRIVPNWLFGCLTRWRASNFDRLNACLDGVITMSETSRRRLIQYGFAPELVDVVYHYDVDSLNPTDRWSRDDPDSVRVLYVGALSQHKGLHVVIEAFRQVVLQRPHAELYVIGGGKVHYAERIRQQISAAGLEERVHMLGPQSNEDVLGLMRSADVVVVAEQWYSEFGPVALMEAMLMERPVVAGRIGSAPEYLSDGVTGLLATYDQPEEFARQILWVLEHPNEANAMGRRARESAFAFLSQDHLGHTLKVYEKAIAHKQVSRQR